MSMYDRLYIKQQIKPDYQINTCTKKYDVHADIIRSAFPSYTFLQENTDTLIKDNDIEILLKYAYDGIVPPVTSTSDCVHLANIFRGLGVTDNPYVINLRKTMEKAIKEYKKCLVTARDLDVEYVYNNGYFVCKISNYDIDHEWIVRSTIPSCPNDTAKYISGGSIYYGLSRTSIHRRRIMYALESNFAQKNNLLTRDQYESAAKQFPKWARVAWLIQDKKEIKINTDTNLFIMKWNLMTPPEYDYSLIDADL